MLAGTYKGTSEIRRESAKKWLNQRLPRVTAPGRPTALDVGCADGTHSRVLSALGYAVTGVDFSARMISTARELTDDSTVHNKPTLLHGEFLAGRYHREDGTRARLDGVQFDLVIANAFVHLFPPGADGKVLRKVLGHVAPGGAALISTTTARSNRQGLETKKSLDGRVARRWRNRYTLESFTRLVSEGARETLGDNALVQPSVVLDPNAEEKFWVDVLVTRQT